MNRRSTALRLSNTLSAARLQGAAFLMLGLIGLASIAGCTANNASLNSKMSATYHTHILPYPTFGQVFVDK